MGGMRKALQDKRVVLGGFRTVIKDGERPMIFMTAHQFIKTFYIALLFRPLSFLRCCSTPLIPWNSGPGSSLHPGCQFSRLAGAACMTAHPSIKNVYYVSVFWTLPSLRCCRPFPAHLFIENMCNVFVFWPLPFLRCGRPFPLHHRSAARLPFPACRAQLPQALCRKG